MRIIHFRFRLSMLLPIVFNLKERTRIKLMRVRSLISCSLLASRFTRQGTPRNKSINRYNLWQFNIRRQEDVHLRKKESWGLSTIMRLLLFHPDLRYCVFSPLRNYCSSSAFVSHKQSIFYHESTYSYTIFTLRDFKEFSYFF